MAESSTNVIANLRQWAHGMYTTEAATELLIRASIGTLVAIDRPWIKPTNHGYWIDFGVITQHLGALSGGEQRLLRIAASIGSDDAPPIRLGEAMTGLDRPTLQLVLAAVAHAGGSHDQTDLVVDRDGLATITKQPSLHPWNEQTRPTGRC